MRSNERTWATGYLSQNTIFTSKISNPGSGQRSEELGEGTKLWCTVPPSDRARLQEKGNPTFAMFRVRFPTPPLIWFPNRAKSTTTFSGWRDRTIPAAAGFFPPFHGFFFAKQGLDSPGSLCPSRGSSGCCFVGCVGCAGWAMHASPTESPTRNSSVHCANGEGKNARSSE